MTLSALPQVTIIHEGGAFDGLTLGSQMAGGSGRSARLPRLCQLVEHNKITTAAVSSVGDDLHQGLLDDLMARVAGCFARRETRLTCRDMVLAQLMELEDHDCWTMAEAAGHARPYRMQHLLSRARFDESRALDAAACWAVSHLCAGQDTGDAVLIVDETADEKSSQDCAVAAFQYSGTVGGTAARHGIGALDALTTAFQGRPWIPGAG